MKNRVELAELPLLQRRNEKYQHTLTVFLIKLQ